MALWRTLVRPERKKKKNTAEPKTLSVSGILKNLYRDTIRRQYLKKHSRASNWGVFQEQTHVISEIWQCFFFFFFFCGKVIVTNGLISNHYIRNCWIRMIKKHAYHFISNLSLIRNFVSKSVPEETKNKQNKQIQNCTKQKLNKVNQWQMKRDFSFKRKANIICIFSSCLFWHLFNSPSGLNVS